MNHANYKKLSHLLQELEQEKREIEEKINDNLLKIKEFDIYTASILEKEDRDFKVFSPRDAESIHKEEFERIKREKLSCLAENERLHQRRDILISRVATVKDILEEEKDLSNLMALSIQEEDRQRIARELHDTSLQNLAHLIHKIELSSLFIDQDPVRAKLELSVVNKNLREIIEEIRCTIFDLRPMSFDDLGLKAAFERLVSGINEKGNYDIDLYLEEVSCENNLILMSIYRVAKECLINIVKHADADRILFHCECKDNLCLIHIEDNGKGFDPNRPGENFDKHFGISVIKERIALIGGKIEIDSKIDQGTKIRIEVPIFNK